MRTIKFRIWRPKTRVMELIEGYGSASNGIFTLDCSFKEDVLLQFTGLLDKNGKEIYEGDVVRITSTEEYYHDEDGTECDDDCKPVCPFLPHQENTVVEWSAERGGFTWDESTLFGGEYTMPFSDLAGEYVYEVIGNIYENKELLSKE